jgi:hypothetical protein
MMAEGTDRFPAFLCFAATTCPTTCAAHELRGAIKRLRWVG